MSPTSPQLDQADRELLVAYLDGELSAEESAVVESRLASDQWFRKELQELQQSWDALGELPRPVVPEEFTRTTLEMVSVAAQEDVEAATTALPLKRRRYLARLLALVLGGTVAGVLLARLVWPDPTSELLASLPIIEHYETYRHIGNMEFLEQLHARFGDRLQRIASLAPEEVSGTWREWQTASHEDEAHRRERVAALEPPAQARLHGRWMRFEKAVADENERRKLQDLHAALLEHDQSQELYATAFRFGELLSERSSGDKAELRSKMSVEERLEMIEDWIRDEERDSRFDLSLEDRRKLLEFQRNVITRLREQRGERRGERRQEGERERPSPEEWEAYQRELDRLVESLSPEAQEKLEDDRGEREGWILRRWLRDTSPSWERMREDLEELFVSIEDNDEKARLLLMPDRELYRELRSRYLGPFDEGGRWDRDRRGPPGRRDGRGRGGPDGRRRGGDSERRDEPPASRERPGD